MYLIDLENVGYRGFFGIETLSAEDTVYCLYTSTYESVINKHIVPENLKCKFICTRVPNGFQSLDMNLTYIMGILTGSGVKDFTVVSKDNGYKNLGKLAKEYNVNIMFADKLVEPKEDDILPESLKDFPTEYKKRITDAIIEYPDRIKFFMNIGSMPGYRHILRKELNDANYEGIRQGILERKET